MLRIPCPATMLLTWCGKGMDTVGDDCVVTDSAYLDCEDCKREMKRTLKVLPGLLEKTT